MPLPLIQPVGTQREHARMRDLRMLRMRPALAVPDEFFVELLAVAEAGEDDVDVLAACCDHPLGNIEDAHRLAHVENEHFAGFADSAGLHHELARFGDRHEIAGRIRVRDRQGTARLDQGGERREHGTPAADHVAETHREEPRLTV